MLRVRIAWTGWSGGPGLSTFYFDPDVSDDAAATACADGVRDAVASTILNFMPDEVLGTVAGDVDVINPATGSITNTLTIAAPPAMGAGGGTSREARSVAVLLRLSTNVFRAGRRVRGRIYWSPLVNNVLGDDGNISNASVTAANGFYAALTTAVGAGNPWVVWHRPVAGAGGEACVIQSCTASPIPAVLTSRRD